MSHNLDYLAAMTSQAICDGADKEKLESLATKCIGILNEDGVYALFLYLLSSRMRERQCMISSSTA